MRIVRNDLCAYDMFLMNNNNNKKTKQNKTKQKKNKKTTTKKKQQKKQQQKNKQQKQQKQTNKKTKKKTQKKPQQQHISQLLFSKPSVSFADNLSLTTLFTWQDAFNFAKSEIRKNANSYCNLATIRYNVRFLIKIAWLIKKTQSYTLCRFSRNYFMAYYSFLRTKWINV